MLEAHTYKNGGVEGPGWLCKLIFVDPWLILKGIQSWSAEVSDGEITIAVITGDHY